MHRDLQLVMKKEKKNLLNRIFACEKLLYILILIFCGTNSMCIKSTQAKNFKNYLKIIVTASLDFEEQHHKIYYNFHVKGGFLYLIIIHCIKFRTA